MKNITAKRRSKVVRFFQVFGWVLLAAALFYALHRYFEYREQQLDERLEHLGNTVDNFRKPDRPAGRVDTYYS